MNSNGTHLLNLINGVLDISKIEAASERGLDLTTVDLAAVADVPAHAPLLTDRARLKQITRRACCLANHRFAG